MNKMERDDTIVAQYVEGMQVQNIASRHGLSRIRIHQILRKRDVPRRIAAPSLEEFLGINLTEPIKDALRVEAHKRGITMTRLSAGALKQMLIACGYPLEAEAVQ